MKREANPVALLPVFVFLVLYLGLGIVFEYIMKIPMGFYNIPIIVAFLVAILTACLQNRNVSFDEKLEIMAQGLADKNIITRAMGVKEEVEADIYEYRLKKGDMILMCTDGLSNMVEDEDMFDIVKGARDIVEAVQMLIEKANSNGGRDNIGVVLAEPLADEVSAW